MDLLPLFKWFDHTALGEGIRSSTYWFPAIEVVHLLGLVLLYGCVLVMNLRLLGFGLRRQSITRVATEVTPYMGIAVLIMLATGIPLFVSEALKCYGNVAFWFKMSFLLVALIFQFTIHRRIISSDQPSPVWSKLVAVFSLALWLGVGLGGRAIAFV